MNSVRRFLCNSAQLQFNLVRFRISTERIGLYEEKNCLMFPKSCAQYFCTFLSWATIDSDSPLCRQLGLPLQYLATGQSRPWPVSCAPSLVGQLLGPVEHFSEYLQAHVFSWTQAIVNGHWKVFTKFDTPYRTRTCFYQELVLALVRDSLLSENPTVGLHCFWLVAATLLPVGGRKVNWASTMEGGARGFNWHGTGLQLLLPPLQGPPRPPLSQTALPSHYLMIFLLSLANGESEANSNNNLMLAWRGLLLPPTTLPRASKLDPPACLSHLSTMLVVEVMIGIFI